MAVEYMLTEEKEENLMKPFINICFFLSFTVLVSSGKAFAIDALVTDNTETEVNVSNFALQILDECSGFMYYCVVATQTEIVLEALPIDNGYLTIWIPFQIIDHIIVSIKEYTVFLHDKTIIKGEISIYPCNGLGGRFEYFCGSTELGWFSIKFYHVKNISFKHKSLLNYEAAQKSKTISSLTLPDDTHVDIIGAKLFMKKDNENGCYIYHNNLSFI